MTDCLAEKQTQHYKGKWYGFGPVRNSETVIFAVFETTKRDGSQLTAKSFNRKYLAKSTQSLARASYLTRPCFDREIVERGRSEKGALVGITRAKVAIIRKLRADIITNNATKKVRAFRVLDRVDKSDFDSHATTGYAEATELGISQKQLSKMREAICMDLANAFSDITSPDRHRWPWPLEIVLKRVASIMRVLRTMATARAGLPQ